MPRKRQPDPLRDILAVIRPPKVIGKRATRAAAKAPALPPARLGPSTKTVCDHCGQSMDLANPVHVAHHSKVPHTLLPRAPKSKRWRQGP